MRLCVLSLAAIATALWCPTSTYSLLPGKIFGNRGVECCEGSVCRYTSLSLSRSKTEFNPYRIIKPNTQVVYEEVPEATVLLSVDLGLRSGFAFYNSTGSLLNFKYHRFDSLLTLQDSILAELYIASATYELTHFVLEGDAIFAAIWSAAINQYSEAKQLSVKIIRVSPAEWRERILSAKERKSGKDAKCAAREISRQIMWKSGAATL